MDDIAQISGIPRATLYYYFSGKDEILSFLLDAMLADLGSKARAAVESSRDVKGRLTSLARTYLELVSTTPVAALLLANLSKIGKLPDISSATDQAFLSIIREVIQDGIGQGDLKKVDVPTAATALFGAITLVGIRPLLDGSSSAPAELSASVVDIFWAGIRDPRSSPSMRGTRDLNA